MKDDDDDEFRFGSNKDLLIQIQEISFLLEFQIYSITLKF